MSDELGPLLRERNDRIAVPPSNLEEVLRGGKVRRRVRATAGGIGLIALVAALLLAFGALPGREQRRSTPTVDRPSVSVDHKLLVIPAPKGAPPLEEDQDAVADAKAVTFAFHALVLSLESYDLDYKDFERIDGGWRVLFEDGPSIEDQRELVTSRRAFIEEFEGYINDERARIERLRDELAQAQAAQSSSEMDLLKDRLRESTESLRNYQNEIAETQAELEEHISTFNELMEQGEGPPITLVIQRSGEHLLVDSYSGSLSSNEKSKVLSYSERVQDVDVHGVDYYNVTLTSNPDADLPLEAYGFWTGPIPSTYQEECLHELRSRTGELLWRMPDVHDVYDKAPPNEDRRDGWVRGSDMEGIGVPLDQAVPYLACSPKEQ
jgi:hypothetical protein